MAITLTVGDAGDGYSTGYIGGSAGSISGDLVVGGTTFYLVSSANFGGGGTTPPGVFWYVIGDVTAELAGLSALSVDGVNLAVETAPAFDGSFTFVSFAYQSWAVGSIKTLDLVFGGPSYSGPTVKSVGAGNAGTGAVTVPLPGDFAAGDRLLIQAESANENMTPPTGYTLIDAQYGTGTAAGSTSTRLAFFTKVAGASESAPSIPDAGNHVTAHMIALSPCDVHAATGDVSPTAQTTANFPALSSTVDNCLFIAGVTSDTDISTARASGWTNGFTEGGDYSSTQGNGGGVAFAWKGLMTAGAIGATQCTMATATRQGRMMIAFSPPSDAPSRKYPRTHSWL